MSQGTYEEFPIISGMDIPCCLSGSKIDKIPFTSSIPCRPLSKTKTTTAKQQNSNVVMNNKPVRLNEIK